MKGSAPMIHHGSRGAYLAGVGEGIREGHGNSGTFCGAGKDNQEGGFSPGPKAGLAKKGRVKAGQARLIRGGGFVGRLDLGGGGQIRTGA